MKRWITALVVVMLVFAGGARQSIAAPGRENPSPDCTYTMSLAGSTPTAGSPGRANLTGTPGEDVGAFVNGILGSRETLCFDPGNYVLSTEIYVHNVLDVTLWLFPGAKMTTALPIRLLHVIGSADTLVHGGRWSGSGAGTLPDIEVDVGSSNTTIEDAEVSHAGLDGILVDSDIKPNFDVSVLNDTLLDNGRFGVQYYSSGVAVPLGALVSGILAENNGAGGVYTERAAGVTVSDNVVENTAAGGGTGAIGIGVALGSNDTVTQNRVSGMTEYGIQAYFNNGTTITDNVSVHNAGGSDQSGITNDHSFHDVISGNTVDSNGRDGIYVGRSSFVTVSDNVAEDNAHYGIEFYHGALASLRNDTVEGNLCSSNLLGGIIFNSVSDSTVYRNTCLDNSGPGILLYNDPGQAGSTHDVVSHNTSGDDRLSGRTQTYGIAEMNQANFDEIAFNLACNNTVADLETVGSSTTTAGNSDCRFGGSPLG